MKNISNVLTPMHEELIKYFTVNIVIEGISEIFGENVIVFVYHSQHLYKV
jgi:hypothetical protein